VEENVKNVSYKVAVLIFAIVGIISFKVYAATPKTSAPQVWTPGCVATVPKSWGTYRGGSTQAGLAFEDSAGTLRFLTNIPCDGSPVVALEIHRTAGNSANGSSQ
jgi:hypothetical protein